MTIFRQYIIRFSTFIAVCALALVLPAAALPADGPRVIEILADKDSHYRIAGQNKPQIALKAGEQVLLRIDARRSKTWSRDGSVHGFTLVRAKDRKPVEGWDFLLQPGLQEFAVRAPLEPGEYEVICTVICSAAHEGMNMKFVARPAVN